MTEIRVPDIGDVDEVEVIELCVAVGDVVAVDDPVVVIESDKASMEVPATAAGTVASLAVAVGDSVRQGDLLIVLEDAAESAEPSESSEPAKESSPDPESAPAAEQAPSAPPAQASVIDVLVPDIGDASDVVVIEVAVQAGDTVAEDDLLVVVESDKASMEIPSPHAGTVKEVLVSVDMPVQTGTLLLRLETAGGDAAPAEPTRAAAPPREAAPATEAPAKPAETEVPKPPSSAPAAGNKSVYAGPAVRRLARELGVDLAGVKGTGSRGRITKDDVKAHVKARMQTQGATGGGSGIPPVPAQDFSRFGPVEVEPLARIRRVGAENLHRSWLNVPHVTQQDEADVTDLEAFRKGLKAEAERRGVKVTPLAFLVKACCQLLKQHPRFNASLDAGNENFILKRYYHIGLAVDTEQGLVVPVVRDADQKGIWELSEEIADLADKARNGKLGMTDLQGGTFSISSLGGIGGTGFTPIVNAPEVAILGVSRMVTKPVWNGTEFTPRSMLPLSLSYDHRAINGAEAGRFMTELCQTISDLRRALL